MAAIELTDDDYALMERILGHAQTKMRTDLVYESTVSALRRAADEHEKKVSDLEVYIELLNRIRHAREA